MDWNHLPSFGITVMRKSVSTYLILWNVPILRASCDITSKNDHINLSRHQLDATGIDVYSH